MSAQKGDRIYDRYDICAQVMISMEYGCLLFRRSTGRYAGASPVLMLAPYALLIVLTSSMHTLHLA